MRPLRHSDREGHRTDPKKAAGTGRTSALGYFRGGKECLPTAAVHHDQ